MKRFNRVKCLLAVLALALVTGVPVASPGADFTPGFVAGKPIWPEGREKEKNLFVGFRAAFLAPAGRRVTLRATGATQYRIWLNGSFLAHGPARGPHGFFRVDEMDLTEHLIPGTNTVAFEVAGYNVNSYYLLDQPSFLQAEVVAGDEVLAATGEAAHDFAAILLKERAQKVQRFSFQRPFIEVYRMAPGFDLWRRNAEAPVALVKCAVTASKSLLSRRVPYPDYFERGAGMLVSSGELAAGRLAEQPWKDRALVNIGPALGGFPESQLETIPSLELQGFTNLSCHAGNRVLNPGETLSLNPRQFHIVDFGVNLTGFVGARIVCHRRARLYFTWDEVLANGDVDFKRLGCVNACLFELEPGTYDIESFEPYTLRYLKLFTLEGECSASGLHLREYVNPEAGRAQFAASDERLNRLFEAGRETFRQNAVDLFMDCPSRERAGWLCDSYFTARVAHDLCGDALVEKNFLENFALPPKFEHLPDGMLPMCYPADHNDGVFIPNWAMWFVLELEEYQARSGDRQLVEALRPRVMKLLEYFKPYRNADGLLEKLPGWVFVEWSKANDFTQDVNYPSNMLFARMLEAASRLYHQPALAQEAEHVRETIRKQSFDGQFFVDNALRVEGKLQVTTNRSEVCQYFAFYFGVATPESHPKLWQTLVRDFGPKRNAVKTYPEVFPANQFIGNLLRLELLSQAGLCQQVADEAFGYWLFMADKTGTLWENNGDYASCNHGFASHAVRVLDRDVLGLARVDAVKKEVELRFTDLKLAWCQGTMPTPDGEVTLRWHKEGNRLAYTIATPASYTVHESASPGMVIVRDP